MHEGKRGLLEEVCKQSDVRSDAPNAVGFAALAQVRHDLKACPSRADAERRTMISDKPPEIANLIADAYAMRRHALQEATRQLCDRRDMSSSFDNRGPLKIHRRNITGSDVTIPASFAELAYMHHDFQVCCSGAEPQQRTIMSDKPSATTALFANVRATRCHDLQTSTRQPRDRSPEDRSLARICRRCRCKEPACAAWSQSSKTTRRSAKG
mmetsp:Transcript_23161/g.57632  ORF Transcript_23161/g.57632 Transcript_23161/m.57632 type:complete len:211 (+) Transcript_23161:25-657(+)